MAFTIFKNKISMIALIIMGLFYTTLISRSIILSIRPNPTDLQPITFYQVYLDKNKLLSGEGIHEYINGRVNIHDCASYALRTIIDRKTSQEIWVTTTPMQNPGQTDRIIEQQRETFVQIPSFPLGNYIYRAEIHMICANKSYIVLVPLQYFEIVDKQ